MGLMKIAVVAVLVSLTSVSIADADQRRRGRSRGRDARIVVQPRVIVRPPVVRRHVYPRFAPFGARLAYRPVYRPGIGVGIYIGSPYRYAYPAYRPYYPAPYAYGYGYSAPCPYPAAIYAVPPPGAFYGGVRLEVTPRNAAVYVDGYYAGIVDDFDGAWQRIALEPGPHRFEIVAPGLETLTFEVNVRPNETVRYRGEMRAVP